MIEFYLECTTPAITQAQRTSIVEKRMLVISSFNPISMITGSISFSLELVNDSLGA